MNLIFLHGPPATGKYTVGRELAALTGFNLYHNHLVVDEVLRQHAFGTPGFIALRDRMWREFLGRAAVEQPPGVIFTFNSENTVPQAFIDWLFLDLTARHVALLSVELVASESAIEARLGSSQRRGFKKLTDVNFYRELRDTGTFNTPVIPRTDLRIETEKLTPDAAAQVIVAQLGQRPA